jgi:hypothetical protein
MNTFFKTYHGEPHSFELSSKKIENKQKYGPLIVLTSVYICSGLREAGIVMIVLVRSTIDLGKPRGVGENWNGEGMGREWGGGGQFTSNLGPGWKESHHTRGGIPSK